jgi:GDP-L-fucose synthase
VIHCAAKVGGIQANINDPVGFLYENLQMNLNVIHGAFKAGIKYLINLGSSCMYPKDYSELLKEEYLLAAPLEPTNEGYALAKLAGAKLCEYCNRQPSTRYTTIIPCNLFGPYDHFDPVSGHLIASALLKLHKAKQNGSSSVEIWGDGTARREFLYVEDLARFIVSSLDRLNNLTDYLNVGYGKDYTVFDYYKMAAEAVGYDVKFIFDPPKPAGMKRKLMDSSLACGIGWKPKTSIPEGMRRAYDFFLQTEEEN